MSEYDRSSRSTQPGRASPAATSPVPGKRTLTEGLTVQRALNPAGPAATPDEVHAAAARGTSSAAGSLPHLDTIQRAFGRHDVSRIQAHTDGAAAEGAAAMGAQAFAAGDHVAFAGAPDLHTAAHEAAHVVQQRGGVQLKGGVGTAGDRYEQHADSVADRVVRGESAEPLLDAAPGAPSTAPGVQRRLDPDPGAPNRYIYTPSGGAPSSMPTVFTHYGHNRFRSDDGRWWSYNDREDRFSPIAREPRHPGPPQPYAAPARSGFSMENRADEASPWNSLLAAAERARDEEHGTGLHATGPFDDRTVEFSARHTNPAARRDLGRVAAQSLGESGRLPANDLAARQDPAMGDDGISREYLHQQSHGGGGQDAMPNLGIGSAAANTEMIPIEAEVNGRSDLRMRVTFLFRPNTQLIEVVEMTVVRAADRHPLLVHRIAGQQRTFTREQYQRLRALVGFAVNPDTLAAMTQLDLRSPWEAAWIQFLTEMRSQSSTPGPVAGHAAAAPTSPRTPTRGSGADPMDTDP